ncbi:MAG: hypothetical protein ACLQGP_31885 [Isosphaeraceae bacterium]
MSKYIDCIYEELFELTSDELVTAIMIGLVLAMALAGIYAIASRKVSERLTLMIGLMILASLSSMTLAVGYVRYKREDISFINAVRSPQDGPRRPHPGSVGHFGPPIAPDRDRFLAEQFIGSADADGDGRISPAEAAKAAERLVREEDGGEAGSIDVEALSRALNRRPGIPPGFGPDRPPGGFDPGAFRPGDIINAVDKDADGRLSREEVDDFVRSADTQGKGSLDAGDLENELRARLGRIVSMAAPPPRVR